MRNVEERSTVVIHDLFDQEPMKYTVAISGDGIPSHFIYAEHVEVGDKAWVLYGKGDSMGKGGGLWKGPIIAAIGTTSPHTELMMWDTEKFVRLLSREEHAKQEARDRRQMEMIGRALDRELAETIDAARAAQRMERKKIFDAAKEAEQELTRAHRDGTPIGNYR